MYQAKILMENEDLTVENLENLTQEELDALDTNTVDNSDKETELTINYKAKYEAEQRRAATLQRIVNKKGEKTINKNNNNTELEKDIAEFKLFNKVNAFSEEHGLTKAQAQKVLSLYPNATAETLKDPFLAAGLSSISSKEKFYNNLPGARSTINTSNTKSYAQMNEQEKKEWFESK